MESLVAQNFDETSPANQQHHRPLLVVLGVTGGIAAYKSVALARLLRKANITVHVIPTAAALEMVGRTTWEAISGNPVLLETNSAAAHVSHVNFGQNADLIVIAPATANTLAKIRAGIADNLLCNTVLAARCPVLVAPAMHTEMWENFATQENVAVLKARGIQFIGPVSGQLTGKDHGQGRMSEPAEIFQKIQALLSHTQSVQTAQDFSPHSKSAHDLPLVGKTVVISGGGTHEPIDPVRFIGNRSSGTMATSLAQAFADLGANIEFISANISTELLRPLECRNPAIATERDSQHESPRIQITRVISAAELAHAVKQRAENADCVIMAAAVADYRIANFHAEKIKRSSENLTLKLTPNPDILKELVDSRKQRKPQVIVGFAAETGDSSESVFRLGVQKAQRKGADLLAINQVSATIGFGDVATKLFIVDQKGQPKATFTGTKPEVAKEFALLVSEQILSC